MRPSIVSADTRTRISQMRTEGLSFQKIADAIGIGKTTVLEAFNGRKPPRTVAQEHPDRITRMTPYNGGCSTVSGLVPVTLPRLRCLEAANDNVPATEREMQVAA